MKSIHVAMHGVTGRMGTNQHFIRSILAIIRQGGVRLNSGEMVAIHPTLLGRDKDKLRHLANVIAKQETGEAVDWSTDVDQVIADDKTDIVFDASSTLMRASVIRKAIEHRKSVYCEKPVATDAQEAGQSADACTQAGIKNGVVQDKLWLPGIRKLRMLRDQGFFGEILGVRGDFGYWIFSGLDADQMPQRPSWNYRKEDGGGMISDMFCHWHYLINDLFGPIDQVLAHATIDVPQRLDEQGEAYRCTADDSAHAIFVLESGVTCQFSNSWTTRVRRDDLLTVQVDGTKGSAVAGLRDCWTQGQAATPRAVWNPDIPQPINFCDHWQLMPNTTQYDNAFKIQWEMFIRHVVEDSSFPYTLQQGADGVALACAGETSSREKRWVSLND